jgi:ABC-2 type transport system permease protein
MMKRIWAICSFELKKLLKKPLSYILMFGMPLLFTLLFGGLIGDSSTTKMTIGFVDGDNTTMSKSLHDSLVDNNLFTLKNMSHEEAVQQVKDKKLTGFLEIPKGFQNKVVADSQPKVNF